MNRTYALPLIPLTFGAGTACGVDPASEESAPPPPSEEESPPAAPPVDDWESPVGDWDITSVEFEGETYALPMVNTESSKDGDFTSSVDMALRLEEAGRAEFAWEVNISYTALSYAGESYDYDYSVTYSGNWSGERGTFDIAMTSDGVSLDLACTLEEDALECTSVGEYGGETYFAVRAASE